MNATLFGLQLNSIAYCWNLNSGININDWIFTVFWFNFITAKMCESKIDNRLLYNFNDWTTHLDNESFFLLMHQREYKKLASCFSFAFLFAVSAENSMKLLSTRLLDVNAFWIQLTPIICVHFWYTYTKCQELLQKPCRRRKQCTMTGVYDVRISIQTNVCYLYFLSLVTSHFVVIAMQNTVSIVNSIWKSCMDSIHTYTQTKAWFTLRYSFVWHIAMRFSVSIQMTRWKDVTFRMGIFNPFQ